MTPKKWYYEKAIHRTGAPDSESLLVVYRVFDEDDIFISEHSKEPGAFNAVRVHNTEVETRFERARRLGNAPGAV